MMLITRSTHAGFSVWRHRNEAHEPGNFNMHTHTTAELYYFVGGKAVYHIEGSDYPLQPGDILLMRPAEAHYIEIDPDYPYERIYLNLDTDLLNDLDPDHTLLRPFFQREAGKRNLIRTPDASRDACRTYLDNMLGASDDRLTALANLILLLRRVGTLFDENREADPQPETLEYRIIGYINRHFTRELTIQELCDRFFISRAQLCRRFRKTTGTSVGKYVAAKRLIEAQTRILRGQKPTEVFAACGYQDYSTFYRAYTRYFGISPKDARNVRLTEDDRLEIV